MRRIVSACLLQTMRFDTANEANPEQEFAMYQAKLDKNKTKYSIEDKLKESDGSLVIKVKKQYNAYRTEGYLD